MATILVIEDAEPVRSTVASSLRFEGHTVIEAQNGRDGMERHAQGAGAFDLVVCDLFMPELGGLEAIRRMHLRAPKLPILAISGGRNALQFVRSHTGGLVELLPKPFSAPELLAAVKRLLPPEGGAAGG